MIRKTMVALGLFAAALLAQAQEVQLRGVSAFPKGMALTDDFARFIAMVNAAGKGIVQIRLLGGPELTPAPEQGSALAKGVFDVLFGAPTFYAGSFPEADAFAGDLLPAARIRAAGGDRIYDQALARRMNAKLLAFAGGDVGLFIFTKEAPPRKPDGSLDLTGIKLRGAPLYNDFFRHLGATSIVMPAADVYTALERGLVSGIGFNLMGLTELGWNRFLSHRVEPAMYKSSLVITMNLDRWKALPEKAREVLARTAVEYETALEAHYAVRQREETARLDKAGMKPVVLTGRTAEDYQRAAFDTMWARIEKNPQVDLDLAATKKAFYGR